MLSQYGILSHIETTRRNPCYQRIGHRYASQTCLILGQLTKNNFKQPDHATYRPYPAYHLDGQGYTGQREERFRQLARFLLKLLVKCKLNPLILVASYTRYSGILAWHRGLLLQVWFLAIRFF